MFWVVQRIRLRRILRQLIGESTPLNKVPVIPAHYFESRSRWDDWFANPTQETYDLLEKNITRATGGHF